MARREWFSSRAAIAASALTTFWAATHAAPPASAQPKDAPAIHNMLLVGEEAVYLSHLPMFQESGRPPMPHRYQVILEVAFTRQDDYKKDRRAHASTIYMISPEPFVLPALVSTEPPGSPLRSFKVSTVSRGHLEREGSVPIVRDVEVTVKEVVHFREFDPTASKPTQLEYVLFGKSRELFLAHLITAPPDFDQVLAVEVSGQEFSDGELAKGVRVVIPGTTNSATERLKAKQTVTGEVATATPLSARHVEIEVVRELFFEEGELRVPPDFRTTPEEKESGFR